jgi:nicotinate-nucleotide adenylyltransferase
MNCPHLRVGLLGGSFNPAHAGHVYISEQAKTLLQLDEVWWILSPQNPLKEKQSLWPLSERKSSALSLISTKNYIKLSEIETITSSPYTVDTIATLQSQFPTIDFVWLMGDDNLEQFDRWHQWKKLAHMIPIAVFARNSSKLTITTGLLSPEFSSFRCKESEAKTLVSHTAPSWIFLPISPFTISATKIRKALESRNKT